MRFAYIDSQGNEVSIPSIDALALRIELGAIAADTQLYDAQADRWGPAHTHEIFHTLTREVSSDGAFIAPPPPMALAPEPEPEPEPKSGPRPADDLPTFDLVGGLEFDGEGDELDQDETAAAPGAGLGLDPDSLGFDLTPADPVAEAPRAPDGGDFGMDFTLADESGPAAPGAPAADEADAPFDFGGFGALELDEPTAPPAAQGVPSDTMDFSSGRGGFGGGLDMEQPMSEFTPDQPPAWMEQDGPVEIDGAMDLRPGARRESSDADPIPSRGPAREEGSEKTESRVPRSRPSPPRRAKKFPVGMIVGVVGAAVAAGGGYFAWTAFFQGGGGGANSAPSVAALPTVTIPDIPVELLPVMRDLGQAAMVGMIADLEAKEAEFDLPVEPRRDWLAGAYLANATQYPDIRQYWEGIEAYVHAVRDSDTDVFHARYVAELEKAGISRDTAALLLQRADSGFLATREDRFEAYALMDDLVNACLDLHDFLVMNESNIEYDPAGGGMSRDPVLEAIPNSPQLGDEIWDRVGRITGALDALGTLDRVTTERLSAVLFDRIRQAAFR